MLHIQFIPTGSTVMDVLDITFLLVDLSFQLFKL